MHDTPFNKFRAAVEILQRGRDVLMDSLAEEVLDQSEDLIEGGFAFNEFLEGQGTRLHFLCLLISQLEQSAEMVDESSAPPPEPSPPATTKKRRSRSKKVSQQASAENSPDS